MNDYLRSNQLHPEAFAQFGMTVKGMKYVSKQTAKTLKAKMNY